MMYLLIVVGIGQLLHFLYCRRILLSVKKRFKVIDARFSNLSQWVISGNQALLQRLEKINEQLCTEEMKPYNISQHEAVELLLLNLLTELSKKEALPHHYKLLLEQLQQLNKTNQPAETVLRPVNRYAG